MRNGCECHSLHSPDCLGKLELNIWTFRASFAYCNRICCLTDVCEGLTCLRSHLWTIERIQNEKVVKFCSIMRACRVRAPRCSVTLTCSFPAEAVQLQGGLNRQYTGSPYKRSRLAEKAVALVSYRVALSACFPKCDHCVGLSP
jgi:hypothetical protein